MRDGVVWSDIMRGGRVERVVRHIVVRAERIRTRIRLVRGRRTVLHIMRRRVRVATLPEVAALATGMSEGQVFKALGGLVKEGLVQVAKMERATAPGRFDTVYFIIGGRLFDE